MGAWLVFGLLCADQLTKALALYWLIPYQAQAFSPGINWLLAFNSGSAFSFLAHSGVWHVWFFLVFSLVMSGLIVVWMARIDRLTRYREYLGLSFILAGALGNCLDRLRYGYVIDFIDVYVGSYHWPVFNLADSTICIGGAVLLYDALWARKLS